MEVIANDPCTFVSKAKQIIQNYIMSGKDIPDNDLHLICEALALLDCAIEKLTQRST